MFVPTKFPAARWRVFLASRYRSHKTKVSKLGVKCMENVKELKIQINVNTILTNIICIYIKGKIIK